MEDFIRDMLVAITLTMLAVVLSGALQSFRV
jgi:hypothetical protein